jgi:hypothetical protein
MSTTLLFVELLIIGTQTSIWLFILILTAFGFQWISNIVSVSTSAFDSIVTVIFLTLIYILGILFDRFADYVFARWDKKIANAVFTIKHSPPFLIRFRIAKENEYLDRQFEYTRSRLRISRASAINFLLITILSILLICTRLSHLANKYLYVIFIGGVGIALTGWSLFAWKKLLTGFYELIKMAIQPNKVFHKKTKRFIKGKHGRLKVS